MIEQLLEGLLRAISNINTNHALGALALVATIIIGVTFLRYSKALAAHSANALEQVTKTNKDVMEKVIDTFSDALKQQGVGLNRIADEISTRSKQNMAHNEKLGVIMDKSNRVLGQITEVLQSFTKSNEAVVSEVRAHSAAAQGLGEKFGEALAILERLDGVVADIVRELKQVNATTRENGAVVLSLQSSIAELEAVLQGLRQHEPADEPGEGEMV